jgi:hypothetical protein
VTSYSEAVRLGPFTFVEEDYNLFYDNFTVFSGEVNSGGHSLDDDDPDFVDPAAGDYHIGLDSAGLDNGLDLGVAVDLDGTPRPIGLGPDRGAYEASMVVPITGLTAENNGPTTLNADTTFTAMVVTGSGVNYVWDFGDGSQGSGQVVAHEYDDVGEYTAVVTASNSLGGMTATTMVLVFEEAIEGLVLVSDSPVELGQQVRLTATVEAGSNVFYSWDFGDGNQGPGPSVTNYFYNMAGVYTVTVTATNSADTVPAMTVVVVVGPAPEDEWFVFMPVMIRP